MSNGPAPAAREPLLVVTGARSRTAVSGGFTVYGGLLIAESRMASFASTIVAVGEGSERDIITAAVDHNVHLVANLILDAIAAPNSHAQESGKIAVGAYAKTIARQWRCPQRSLDGEAAIPLMPAASSLVAALARGLGALEEGRADTDLEAILRLFPRTSTGKRNRAALTMRPAKITVTQYRNRYSRLSKAIDALSG
jgi:hypothetical protein